MTIREIISNVESLSSKDIGIDLPRSRVCLDDVLQKILPWINGRLEEQELILKKVGDPKDNHLLVNFDTFTYQVFNNLLINAINSSSPNSEIILSAEKQADGVVSWSIKDHGSGIHPSVLEEDNDATDENNQFRKKALGIRIAKIFAKKQGIHLSWESSHLDQEYKDAGTTVRIEQSRFGHE